MEAHTHNDLNSQGLQPRLMGDRLKYGERFHGDVRLADEWRYHDGRSYAYGQSKVSLRPEVIDDDAPKPEPVVPSEQEQREEYIKAKRARDRAIKRRQEREWRKRWTAPKPEPLIPIITEVQVAPVLRLAPMSLRQTRYSGHTEHDPRPTGADVMAVLDELD